MAIERLDHISIRTAQVDRAVGFYGAALGLVCGPRPPFDFPGAWLYTSTPAGEPTGGALVHIVGVDANAPAGLQAYLGDKPADAHGSGAFDHAAFSATDIEATRARLNAAGIAFRERLVPKLGLRQIFVDDPDGITLELNFAGYAEAH